MLYFGRWLEFTTVVQSVGGYDPAGIQPDARWHRFANLAIWQVNASSHKHYSGYCRRAAGTDGAGPKKERFGTTDNISLVTVMFTNPPV